VSDPAARPALSLAGRLYVGVVGWIGLAAFVYSSLDIARAGFVYETQWLVFVALTFASGRFTLKVPSVAARFSVSEMFAFTSVLLFGPATGAVTLAIDSVFVSWRHRMSGAQMLFNFSNLSLAVWLSGTLFFLVSGAAPLFGQRAAPTASLVLPLAVMAGSYFIVNSGLIAIAIGLHTGQRPFEVWRSHFMWLGPGYLAGASVALLLVVAFFQVRFSALALLFPVLMVSYLMLRSSFGRLEDAKQHVDRLNGLYLSTIETLATAIDAKDDVTHDHVRRVQGAAVALAKELGISDPQLLKAIEAAGLLHDTGKIAVPEHILNKPGRLTPAEFEKIKLHAPIGADILSAIDFPYPVVPIVRHHHENWDGTGYPDGVRGTDIPIGARILSVVDCFDALTSDRPYRRRMTDEDALKIIVERRGTMYDPLVVDTFVKSYQQIMPVAQAAVHPAARAVGSARSASAPAPEPTAVNIDTPAFDEIVAFTSLARAVSGEAGLSDLGSVVWVMVRQIVPSTGLALFVPDQSTDSMVATYAAGPYAVALRGARYEMSHGPVGWSAVNRRMIVNGDALVDVDTMDTSVAGAPPHWVCTLPLVHEGNCVAVVALYAPKTAPFAEQQAQLLELLAPRLADAVATINTKHAAAHPVETLPTARPRAASLRVLRRA
jgi:putative nucleotidyltransferase with HDIG domain